MTLRSQALRVTDLISGGKRQTQRDALAALAADAGEQLREQQLADLLHHATTKVPYYRSYADATQLSQFPVVSKLTHLEYESDMLADDYDPEQMHIASTSGSTGIPFRVRQDPGKRQRSMSEVFSFGTAAGYEVGTRLYHLKIWSDRNKLSRWQRFTRNILPVDILRFDEQQATAVLDDIAAHRRPVAIISYSSGLEILAKALNDYPAATELRGRITGVIGQSELLPQEVREVFADRIGVWPVARYGMEELGIIAQQRPTAHGTFLINRATFVTEILTLDSDVPVQGNEIGRIVITDMANRAQPLIRYDTGDCGSWATDSEGRTDHTAIAAIEGRQLDRIFDTHDRPLSPLVAYQFFWRHPSVRQYQIIQQDRGDYLVRLNAPAQLDEHSFATDFASLVGTDATIAVEYSQEGFVAASGKRRSIVSHYTPSS